MKLNDKEKTELINFLKEQYNTSKKRLSDEEFDWIQDEETRNAYVNYLEEIKEKYEALENTDEINLEFDIFNSNRKNIWNGIIGLIAVSAIFGSNNWLGNNDPENNKNLN